MSQQVLTINTLQGRKEYLRRVFPAKKIQPIVLRRSQKLAAGNTNYVFDFGNQANLNTTDVDLKLGPNDAFLLIRSALGVAKAIDAIGALALFNARVYHEIDTAVFSAVNEARSLQTLFNGRTNLLLGTQNVWQNLSTTLMQVDEPANGGFGNIEDSPYSDMVCYPLVHGSDNIQLQLTINGDQTNIAGTSGTNTNYVVAQFFGLLVQDVSPAEFQRVNQLSF